MLRKLGRNDLQGLCSVWRVVFRYFSLVSFRQQKLLGSVQETIVWVNVDFWFHKQWRSQKIRTISVWSYSERLWTLCVTQDRISFYGVPAGDASFVFLHCWIQIIYLLVPQIIEMWSCMNALLKDIFILCWQLDVRSWCFVDGMTLHVSSAPSSFSVFSPHQTDINRKTKTPNQIRDSNLEWMKNRENLSLHMLSSRRVVTRHCLPSDYRISQ